MLLQRPSSGYLRSCLGGDRQIRRVARQRKQPLCDDDDGNNNKSVSWETRNFQNNVTANQAESMREQGGKNHTSHFIKRAACLCHARRDNLCEVVDLGASAGEVANGTAIIRDAVDDAVERARGEFVDEAGDVGGGGGGG